MTGCSFPWTGRLNPMPSGGDIAGRPHKVIHNSEVRQSLACMLPDQPIDCSLNSFPSINHHLPKLPWLSFRFFHLVLRTYRPIRIISLTSLAEHTLIGKLRWSLPYRGRCYRPCLYSNISWFVPAGCLVTGHRRTAVAYYSIHSRSVMDRQH